MQELTIALSKGAMLEPTLALLAAAGLPTAGIAPDARQMVFAFAGITYIMCRPTDVPVYVEHGAADIGIAGKDVIVEQGKDIFELLDLGFGDCHFAVIVPEEQRQLRLKELNYKRVATKFTRTTAHFFRQQGLQVEVIKLNGNVELAPLMGLADAIVDLVSSGRTLRENRLVELTRIMDSTARLICNQVSYRIKNQAIQGLLAQVERVLVKGVMEHENKES
jgi:ATP phosphoribosyltransferase